ncbi:MAG: sigma-54-dependent Fis family transcriptional regulator [Gammaproteobacteria bacterium]|nr:MAG: sigma-54-dependent Fis family transcriptional regulator [Gammaproteobacteria bacterium]
MAQNILIVDDEPDIRELLDITLIRMGHSTHTAADLASARQALSERHFDLCLTDMNLPDGNGIDLVRHIQKHHPATPVAVITAYGSVDTAIAALKAGAFDFVSKPVELARLRDLVTTALKLTGGKSDEGASLKRELLGQSPAIETLRRQIRKLARSQAPIYISGESGSGKELVARMIHTQGPRADAPFVPVNCGAIPSELMESEFFGHRKGAFTGATDHKEGLFQAANGGTLFLDEVADLPLPMQVKLLRAIQEKAVRPVGGDREIPVDVRILAATHKNLQNEVTEGRFRQDLFYRINVIELKVPPLRERKEDIPLLARHILDKLSAECDLPPMGLTQAALDKLTSHPFPGNVRELENALERAFTLCDGDEIDAADLVLESAAPAQRQEGEPSSPIAGDVPDITGDVNLEEFLESIEKQAIEKALEETRWNKTAAAKKLGISFRALRYRLKKLGMD